MTDEREKLLDFILDNLEVKKVKSVFESKKYYPVISFKNEKVAFYDLNCDDEMFKKLVKELEERQCK